MEDLLRFVEDQKIIAVIRVSDHSDAECIAKAVIDGGIRVIEITPHVSQSTKLVETLAKQSDVVVGLGSATDGEQAYRAIQVGARFVSSLYLDNSILTVCKNNNAMVMQGASTVTEAIEAYHFGVDLVRLFPADFLGGAPYVKCLRRSFPFLKVVPTSGVTLDNFLDYIRAGATACAVGRGFYDASMVRGHLWSEITDRAKQFAERLESLKVTR
ncbi:MAG: hypothetical protein A3G87_00390 [Omnitrophica bacterium RIFCSPLOWO2_12_FULL_50_11]|nr:MAG: hypothetical protein A3G87_00390 [Omnitrophica bacterium RIFCSPLOWO2_12_FULL_50_11]